jgi:hypothetical protein
MVALARREGNDVLLSLALRQRAALRAELGDRKGALSDARSSVEDAPTLPPRDFTESLAWYGMVATRVGELEEGEAALSTALKRGHGLQGVARYGLGCGALERGDVAHAILHLEEARVLLGDGDAVNRALSGLVLAQAYRRVGRLEESRTLARAELDFLETEGFEGRDEGRVCLGITLLAADRVAEAGPLLTAAAGADATDDARVAVAALALWASLAGEDPVPWLERFEPAGPVLSRAYEVEIVELLEQVAAREGAGRAGRMARDLAARVRD